MVAGVIVTVATQAMNGRYTQLQGYDSSGRPFTYTTCKDFWGTCSMPSRRIANGQSISTQDEIIDNADSPSREIRAHLIPTNVGVLYAIDKINDQDDCDYFFNSEIKTISGTLVIDNPEVLASLNKSAPIIVHGDYDVYEDDQYKFIIISE